MPFGRWWCKISKVFCWQCHTASHSTYHPRVVMSSSTVARLLLNMCIGPSIEVFIPFNLSSCTNRLTVSFVNVPIYYGTLINWFFPLILLTLWIVIKGQPTCVSRLFQISSISDCPLRHNNLDRCYRHERRAANKMENINIYHTERRTILSTRSHRRTRSSCILKCENN